VCVCGVSSKRQLCSDTVQATIIHVGSIRLKLFPSAQMGSKNLTQRCATILTAGHSRHVMWQSASSSTLGHTVTRSLADLQERVDMATEFKPS
jgi:hypothetical protein